MSRARETEYSVERVSPVSAAEGEAHASRSVFAEPVNGVNDVHDVNAVDSVKAANGVNGVNGMDGLDGMDAP